MGYAGGQTEKPTYKAVCSDSTGHAEAIEIEYDPSLVSYGALLEIFWANHDPTTPNRQGLNSGSQYRSVIFYADAEQETAARASKAKLEQSGRFRRPIVTEIVPATTFWPAEDNHQQYYEKQGFSGSSATTIRR